MTRAEAIERMRAACDDLAALDLPEGIEVIALGFMGDGCVEAQLWSTVYAPVRSAVEIVRARPGAVCRPHAGGDTWSVFVSDRLRICAVTS